MARVTIVNITGYTGVELARILARHPGADIIEVTGRSAAGKQLAEIFPHLAAIDMPIKSEVDRQVDIAFLALPHQAAAEVAPTLLQRGIKVIDLSADFRLKNAADYEHWYDASHPAPDLLASAVYGLTELNRDAVREARLIANPGCYPTSAILALAPALQEGILEPGIIIDSKSGVSGAGRSPNLTTHFCEVSGGVSAYGLKGHRHLPEIVQELQRQAPGAMDLAVTFVPHLIPMTRGILSTCYATLAKQLSADQVREIYLRFYSHDPFVRVVEQPPHTKQVLGSNYCHIYPTVDQRTRRLIVVSVIDNLMKGAAGQAVQNMNVMLGIPETTGLDSLPLFP
ncbi:MAG: N-acetyl-gamma-glutamyl-phosphate reductase [Candidatus Marsarchaeota archaeon]|nr:N-acetyl-gamma-glutamyl-phosphate reductase [Candidatus Marsarchaeota archaeon]